MESHSPGEKSPHKNYFKILFSKKFGVIIVITLFVIIGSYLIGKYDFLSKGVNILNIGSGDEVTEITNKVGRIVELPEGETPALATVSDLAILKDQPFFANARIGDKLLLYLEAKRAFLYRPSSNKIVQMGPTGPDKNPQISTQENDDLTDFIASGSAE